MRWRWGMQKYIKNKVKKKFGTGTTNILLCWDRSHSRHFVCLHETSINNFKKYFPVADIHTKLVSTETGNEVYKFTQIIGNGDGDYISPITNHPKSKSASLFMQFLLLFMRNFKSTIRNTVSPKWKSNLFANNILYICFRILHGIKM